MISQRSSTVESVEERCYIVFRVVDTGIGMAPSVQKNIFEPFQQADSSTTREYGGTGLGLSISSQLVKSMGGRLKCVVNLEPVQCSNLDYL